MASIDQGGRTWRARVRLQGFPTKTRSFDTRREAERWARREENALIAGVESVPDLSTEMTLSEALDKYKREETVNKKGVVQESRRIEAWKKHPLAALKLWLLRPQHFIEYRKERLKSASKNTVRLDLSVISVLFNVAKADWGMPYLQNPLSLRGLSSGKGRDRRLDQKERARFSSALTDCDDELFVWTVLFALHTAARQGEILRLRRDDVDFQKRSVIFRDTKNGDDRTVPLTKSAIDILKHVLSSQAQRK